MQSAIFRYITIDGDSIKEQVQVFLSVRMIQVVKDSSQRQDRSSSLAEILGRSFHYVSTYLKRASGRIHKSIRGKMLNAFFSSLPSKHPLSATSHADSAQKKDFARRVHHVSEYYGSDEYNEA